MRRIKSWLISTMSENSLNNEVFDTIHKHRIDAVGSESVAKVFVASNEQRQRYFETLITFSTVFVHVSSYFL